MNRRTLIKIIGATAVGLELSGCDGTDKSKGVVQIPNSLPPFSSDRLYDSLEKLRLAFEDKNLNVSDTLLPPLTEAELRSRCEWFPEALPEELVSLYSWRGGQHPGPWDLSEPDHPFWFRDYAFSSIETAEIEYSRMMETYGSNPLDYGLLVHCFPFAEFNGGWLVMPTKANGLKPRLPRPIISVDEGIDVFFYTIESMVATCIDWVRHPEYEEGGSYLSREVELEIWNRHNPGIFDAL